jgi:short-subunit dehydrogenase
VLVNNAGVEFASAFAGQPPEELRETIEINLVAPVLLTRRVLPGMLERGRGHVVFIASLAGKAPTPYEAVYAASKAGLIGLVRSLRVEYRRAPVGFSVICPGFVAGEGMYQRMVEQGVSSNRILGETTTDKVAAAVIEAIQSDRSQVVESGAPIKPLLALGELTPRALERAVAAAGVGKIFRAAAATRGRTD